MDPDVSRNESVPTGLLDAVASANDEHYREKGVGERTKTDPANTQTKTTQKQTQKASTGEDFSEDGDPGDNEDGLDTQDFTRKPVPSRTEVEEPTNEPSQTETKTETETPSDYDWLSELPTPPEEVEIKPPTPDEFGNIDPVEYGDYLEARLDQKRKLDSHNTTVVTKAFDAVEKILPEVKDTPALQKIIRTTFFANNNPIEIVDLARELRTTLDGKTQAGKTAGIQNAKTSIEIQKKAAVETKSPSQKTAPKTNKDTTFERRLARGDTDAFEALMTDWQSQNKV
jgi:hypothetical protein